MTEINAYMNGYQPEGDTEFLAASLEAHKKALEGSQQKVERLDSQLKNSDHLLDHALKASGKQVEIIDNMLYLIKDGKADIAWKNGIEYMESIHVDEKTMNENRQVIFKDSIALEQKVLRLETTLKHIAEAGDGYSAYKARKALETEVKG